MPVVFVTGGAKKLGKYLTFEFARKGFDTGIIYNESSESAGKLCDQIKSLGRKCSCVKADLRIYKEIDSAFQSLADELGTPDILVNNAGVFPPPSHIEEMSESVWDDTFNINLRAAWFTAKIFSEVTRRKGRIINIGSSGAFEIWKNRIPYNVSKAGLIKLTRALARELAPGITVNCVSPGYVVFDDAPESNAKPPLERIPAGRYANPSDIFSAVEFFAECSDYITGQSILVDGGNSLAR